MLKSESGSLAIKKVRFADNYFSRLKGLMFEQKKRFDYALVFTFNSESRIGASIHMLFVFFPIDAVFLDSKRKVVDKATLNPWMLNYTPKKKAKYLIELAAGAAGKLRIGEKIQW